MIGRYCFAVMLFVSAATFAAEPVPRFEAETIADDVQIGYGVAIGDVDGDGKKDILLADKTKYVWYRSPDWQRFTIIENLTPQDNVCIAARDIDGDGKVEVAVGANWNPSDTTNSGSVHFLVAPEDRTQLWSAIQLHHEPTVHRMHWLRVDGGRFVLVVSPLHGRGNSNGEGEGVQLLAYEVPHNLHDKWNTTVIENTMHMTHNLDPVQWLTDTDAEELLYIGREGAMLLSFQKDQWQQQKIDRIEGGGEIRMGIVGERPVIATIEPMHGDKLVVYLANQGTQQNEATEIAERIVLDDNLNGGHAIACADFLGNGRQAIVAGWRLPNRDGKVGVKLYSPIEPNGREWNATWIDEGGMATEDLRVADLNDDGRPDIIASGRATNNLKVYWNRGADDSTSR